MNVRKQLGSWRKDVRKWLGSLRKRTLVAGLALGVLIVLGLFALADAVGWGIPTAIAVAIPVVLAWPRAVLVVARLLVASLVALLVLAGFNVIAGWLSLHPPIWLGLAIALFVFGFSVYLFLRGADWGRRPAGLVAGAVSALVILGLPVLVALDKGSGDGSVPVREAVASRLDVLIVTDGSRHPPPAEVPREPSVGGFDVRYSVGYADGDGMHWTLTDGEGPGEVLRTTAAGDRLPEREAPVLRQGADSVLLLLVDGTPPVTEDPQALEDVQGGSGEVARWQQLAASFPGTPAFALLQSTDEERLGRWESFSAGKVVSVQKLASLTVTDAAVRLAIASPTSQEDFALAREHQPLLLFDIREPVPRPLSVQGLFDGGKVRLCDDLGITGSSDCGEQALKDPRELENGGTHLRIERPDSEALRKRARSEWDRLTAEKRSAEAAGDGVAPAATPPPGTGLPGDSDLPPGSGSAIYVHPVASERDGKRLLYLDYWWYLPENPSDVGGGALCGAGLVIAGLTCANHQSDWEGITVVVDRTGAKPFVTAVQYAQHNNVVRYDWRRLRRRWRGNPRTAPLVADAAGRPLAFVAKGTHASYPLPCPSSCKQVATSFGEGRHRGKLPWVGNESGACGEVSCLQMLPTHSAGTAPAVWNAYDGAWGEVSCFLAYYCDSGVPPKAPGQQGRYRHPTRYSGSVDKDWRFQRSAFED